jgi:hypothetical protein
VFAYPKFLHLDGYRGIYRETPERVTAALVLVVNGDVVAEKEIYSAPTSPFSCERGQAVADLIEASGRFLGDNQSLGCDVVRDFTGIVDEIRDFADSNQLSLQGFRLLATRAPSVTERVYHRPGTHEYILTVQGQRSEPIDAATPEGLTRLRLVLDQSEALDFSDFE